MSLLKSNYNLCVLELETPLEGAGSTIHDKLLAKKFMELTPSQDFGHGWVAIHEIFKSQFTLEDAMVGENFVGGYRYDQKKVPNPLIKKLYLEKLKEKKGEKLNKLEKKNLKDECKSQLLIKALPNPKMVTWILETSTNRIFLDAKSDKVVENFIKLFQETFGINLKVINFNIPLEKINGFLEWLWVSISKLKGISIHTNVVFDADDTSFNFTGPLTNYLEEIDSIKHEKIIKKLSLEMTLQDLNFLITLNSKNTYLVVKNTSKLNHESVETAVIDNLDRLNKMLNKLNELANDYLTK